MIVTFPRPFFLLFIYLFICTFQVTGEIILQTPDFSVAEYSIKSLSKNAIVTAKNDRHNLPLKWQNHSGMPIYLIIMSYDTSTAYQNAFALFFICRCKLINRILTLASLIFRKHDE